MIKICYIPHGREYHKIKGVYKFLPKGEFSFVFASKHRSAVRMHQRDGFESHYIGGIFEEKTTYPPEELQRIDAKYGPYGIRAIVRSDLYIPYLTKDTAEQESIVARAYKFWEGFFAENKFDYVLVNDTGSVDTRTAYNVVKTIGHPPIGRITLGPKHNQFVICDIGEELCWQEFLDTLELGPKPLTSEQRSLVDNFLEERKKQVQAILELNFLTEAKMRSKKFITLLRQILAAKIRGEADDFGMRRYSLSKFMRKTWWRYFTRHFFPYDYPREGERFVYYPVFYSYEIMKKALHYYWTQNQLSLIKEIASSLPSGIKLYVKEHPGAEGNCSFRFLTALKKIPHVKVINPYIVGQKLIEGCEAVVNLDGTSGWEAFIRRKPVVNITPFVYFARSPLVYKVGSPCELPVTLFRAIQKGSQVYDENEEEWLWFIYSAISTCGEGIYLGTPVNSEENYKSMAEYIGKKIRKAVCAAKQ